jgi:hypothetical protein
MTARARRHSSSYRACSTKRARRTKADIGPIKEAILDVLGDDHPMTVRQVFYQLVVRGVIEKSEAAYQSVVIRLLTDMRLNGVVRWEWIIDETRRIRQMRTFDGISDALNHTARFYRRSALQDCGDYIEIWCEKEALAGLIWGEALDYDVPVLMSKGMPSLTQLIGTAKAVNAAWQAGKFTYIYQFGDHDPTGALIPQAMERGLDQLCETLDCRTPEITRAALTAEQIRLFDLPARPNKRDGNTHANRFEDDSTELDALPAHELRQLVRGAIEQHISPSALETLRAAAASERETLMTLAREHGPGTLGGQSITGNAPMDVASIVQGVSVPQSENRHRWRPEMPMLDDMYPSKYLSSGDAKAAPGGVIVDTIVSIKMEEMTSPRGQKQFKPVTYLLNNKPMVLNKTNATRLANFLGSKNSDDWLQARVTIGVEQVQSIGGGLTDGIRFQGARKPMQHTAAPAPQSKPQQPATPPSNGGGSAAPDQRLNPDIDDELPW